MSEHLHAWEPRPEFSGREVTRYACACGAWGWRRWPRRRGAPIPPVNVYAKGFDAERYRDVVARSEQEKQRYWDAQRAERRARGLEP